MAKVSYNKKQVSSIISHLEKAANELDGTHKATQNAINQIYSARGSNLLKSVQGLQVNDPSSYKQYIQENIKQMQKSAAAIEKYNEDVADMNFFVRLGATWLLLNSKITEGAQSVLEHFVDGGASAVAFIQGKLGFKDAQKKTAKFIKKDWVGDYYYNLYTGNSKNPLSGIYKNINKYSYVSHTSKVAGFAKFTGSAVGYVAVFTAGGAALGAAKAATGAAGAAGSGASLSTAAGTALKLVNGKRLAVGLTFLSSEGAHTQDHLASGDSFDNAFGKATGESVVDSAITWGLMTAAPYVAKGMSKLTAKGKSVISKLRGGKGTSTSTKLTTTTPKAGETGTTGSTSTGKTGSANTGKTGGTTTGKTGSTSTNGTTNASKPVKQYTSKDYWKEKCQEAFDKLKDSKEHGKITTEEYHKAIREAAKKYHPDRSMQLDKNLVSDTIKAAQKQGKDPAKMLRDMGREDLIPQLSKNAGKATGAATSNKTVKPTTAKGKTSTTTTTAKSSGNSTSAKKGTTTTTTKSSGTSTSAKKGELITTDNKPATNTSNTSATSTTTSKATTSTSKLKVTKAGKNLKKPTTSTKIENARNQQALHETRGGGKQGASPRKVDSKAVTPKQQGTYNKLKNANRLRTREVTNPRVYKENQGAPKFDTEGKQGSLTTRVEGKHGAMSKNIQEKGVATKVAEKKVADNLRPPLQEKPPVKQPPAVIDAGKPVVSNTGQAQPATGSKAMVPKPTNAVAVKEPHELVPKASQPMVPKTTAVPANPKVTPPVKPEVVPPTNPEILGRIPPITGEHHPTTLDGPDLVVDPMTPKRIPTPNPDPDPIPDPIPDPGPVVKGGSSGPSSTPSPSPRPKPTPTPTPKPDPTPTPTPEPTPTPTPTPEPTPTITPTSDPTPTITPSVTDQATPTEYVNVPDTGIGGRNVNIAGPAIVGAAVGAATGLAGKTYKDYKEEKENAKDDDNDKEEE